MRAFPITSFGIENLQPRELPIPEVQPGTVLVKVHAVSLNYRDLMMVRGLYNPKMHLPRIPCSDGAGEVVAVGPGVDRVVLGDRVCGIFMQQWLDGHLTEEKSKLALGGDADGMLAEYVLLSQEGVTRFPSHLTYEEASTLPCAAVTAWNALHIAGDPANPITAGSTVVIQGTGGVSIFALQFAKHFGATVLGTSSSDEKLARAGTLGLDSGLNYNQDPEWARWIMDSTNGIGADRVIEVGGAGTLGQSLRALRPGGTVSQIGVLSGVASAEPFPFALILHKQLRIQGIYVGSRAIFEQMNVEIEQSRLKPVIDRVFEFDQSPRAFEHMQHAAHFGKIVIRVGAA